MAKKRLKLKDKQGNVIDYDISAASVTIDAEGRSVEVKLAELVAAIAETVTSVTFNGEPHSIYNRRIDLGNQMQPDWEESSPTYPSYIRNKPNVVTSIKVGAGGSTLTPSNGVVTLPDSGGQVECDTEMSNTSEHAVQNKVVKAYVDGLINGLINGAPAALDTLKELADALGDNDDAIAALTNAISSKANAADIPTKTSDLNNDSGFVTETEMESAIDEAVDGLGGGSVESVTINGTKHTPDSQGDVDLGTIQGEKGEKGDTGNVEFEDLDDLVALLVNDLTTGGAGNFLSAEMGLLLKSNVIAVQANIQRLYTKLANMAFWDAEDKADAAPTAIDWQVPKKTLTITNSIPNSVISYNGAVVSGNLLIDTGETISLLVGGTAGYEIASVTAQGTTVVNNGDGTFTVRVRVNDDMTLAISGTSIVAWRTLPHDDVTENGTVIMYGIQQGRSMMAENAPTGRGHMTSGLSGLESGNPLVASAPAGMPAATKVFTTSTPDGVHTESNPGDTEAYYLSTGGKRYLNVRYSYSGSAFNEIKMAVGCFTNDVIGNVFVNNGHTAGFVGRYPYGVPTSGTAWKIDLNTFATQKGFTAGSITYVKLLLTFNQDSTAVDTRTVINDLVVEYKFTDD